MKKSNLWAGMLFILGGVVCLAIALMLDTRLDSLLFGFAGGLIAPGAIMIIKYFYWTAPQNRSRYAERLDNERIELGDERKERLRDKSGRYAYLLGLPVLSASVVLFAILGKLEVITNAKLIILYLAGYFVFQYVAGVVIFRHLNHKY
ncbi:hypothetical protein DesLBE_2800 [Desulfitobacterium sp. LBE]|uniref:Uncharacterized protein n=2 Tax=root TaxID=1 RepID=B8FUW5_DESHD|nr:MULTISPECIES: hypothetical protein [Desulfitobacterium]ACL18611.1 conserved hypothetical protein [Desulfitobacterium hafniense DCB-2]MEA5024156.1 hypothetical protein [Desulfitobacterium hafniense]TWH58473.1 hypothetical protein DesLBE_2800 [Desulfitobacterium sp. LBE]